MRDPRAFQRRRRLRWSLLPLWFGLTILSFWSNRHRLDCGGCLDVFVVSVLLVMVIGIVIQRSFFQRPGVRRFLKWSVLLTAVILTLITSISHALPPLRGEAGHPGHGIFMALERGQLDLEIDYSHETRHAVEYHGAPGYYHIQLPFSFALLVLVPLTFLLWAENLYQHFPWLKHRYPEDHCQACGYNLTCNVSGICSECGTPVVKKDED